MFHIERPLVITHNGIGDLSTSISLAIHGRGHVSRIGSRPAEEFARPTFAAGAVLWRPAAQPTAEATAGNSVISPAIEIAVVHRPRYDDWSLPKGKVDPGENFAATATREIIEETGLVPQLGWVLGYVHYPLKDRTKVVYYWTAQAIAGEFTSNDEVDELRWVSPAEAMKLLSYEGDSDVVNAALGVLSLGCNRRVLYVRHAKAHAREGWPGNDDLRPLTKKGRRQAEMLVSQLEGYRPVEIHSATPERCVHTVTPLAQDQRLQLQINAELGDAALDHSTEVAVKAFAAVTGVAESSESAAHIPEEHTENHGRSARESDTVRPTVVVGQGGVIPEVLNHYFEENSFEIDDLRVKKSSTWVLHFRGDQLLGADYLASPLAVK